MAGQPVEVQRLVATLEARFNKYEKALNRAQGRTNRTFTNIERRGRQMERRLATVGQNALRPLILQLAAVVAPAALLAKTFRTISEASDLAKIADKVGIGVEALQRLRFGFELTGVAAGATDVALQRFSRRIGEAANGTGELFKIVEANNLALRNQDGSMRDQVDILADYADLIKNASSEQERLLLAFKAFDTEGAGLVNALRKGSRGLDELLGKADEAGGVIEERLIRRAEELDDKFTSLWRAFSINAKSALLSAADFFDTFADRAKTKLGEIGNSNIFRQLAEFFGAEGAGQTFVPGVGPVGTSRGPPRRGGRRGPREGAKPTVVPQGGTTTTANELERAIATLEKRVVLIDAETAAQAKLNPLIDDYGFAVETAAARQALLTAAQEAGVTVTPELRTQIEQLALSYGIATSEAGRLAEEQQELRATMDNLRSLGENVMRGFISDLREGKSAADALSGALDRIASRLIDLSLQQIFNPGTGGFSIGALFGRAHGGPIRAGQGYLVGEHGPETIVSPTNARVVPGAAGGGGNLIVNIQNNTSEPISETRRQSGRDQIADIVVGPVGKALADGRLDSAMKRFGASPVTRQR